MNPRITATRRCLLIALAAAVLVLSGAPPAGAGSDFRQVGYFRSDGANISVGDGHVRVVTVPNIPPELLQDGMMADTSAIGRLYPGWDFRRSLVIFYRLTAQGYRQEKFLYGLGVERTALPDDPLPASLALFDHKGDRRAKIPRDLHELIGADVPIVAAMAANLDADRDSEWVVVVAGPWVEAERGARMKVSLVDRQEGQWELLSVFTIDEPRRAGPLEVRDVTGDHEPDVIFRTFHETTGHFWVEARIFSAHSGLPSMFKPPSFIPSGAPAKE
jgi:ABC-type amino acid transport substrate-binding protein